MTGAVIAGLLVAFVFSLVAIAYLCVALHRLRATVRELGDLHRRAVVDYYRGLQVQAQAELDASAPSKMTYPVLPRRHDW